MRLKRERDAVVLAHNYMTPEIYHCVADVVGDSLALAKAATQIEARVIVMAGVHFMAETAKLMNPEKVVLIPDTRARVLAGDLDRRRRRAGAASSPSRRSRRRLRQYDGGGEGGGRHLLHVGERARHRRVAWRAARHHAARQVSRRQRRQDDGRRNHLLGRRVRGARRLQRRRRPRAAFRLSRRRRARASRVPAGGRRRRRLRRLDGADVGLHRRSPPAAGRCC